MTALGSRRRRTSTSLLGVLITVALAGAGCSRDKESSPSTTAAPSTAAPSSALTPSASSVATGATTGSSSVESTTSVAAETSTTVAAPGPGDFGTLKQVCGPGDAKGATAQGVSDTEIVIGTPSDVGNTVVPGLNQELWDSADAFVGWCNDAGGINGRKIKLIKHDAKLFEAGARMVEACQTDFFLVGGGMALDEASVEPRVGCGLPSINGYAVGEHAVVAPLQLSPIATSNKWSDVGVMLRLVGEKDPSVKPFFGEWSSQIPSIQPPANRARKAAPWRGFTEVYFEELPAAVDNWRPLIEQLKASNVQVLTMYNTPENLASAMRTMSDVGYFPKYIVVGGNHYNDKLIAEAGDALNKTTLLLWSGIVPFEDAAKNPATQQYIDLLKKYANGAKPKSLGVNGFSAWLLFAQSAKACGSDLTRECVMEKASNVADWTGGGLHVAGKPADANGEPSECFTLLQATPGGFVLNTDFVTPNEGIFNCDPANAEHVPGL